MLAASIIAACVSGVLGNYGDSDKVSGVTTLLITCYETAGCTGDVLKIDYKSIGACYQSASNGQLVANVYKMGTKNATHYYKAKYTDDACTTNASDHEYVPLACTEKDGKYCTAATDTNACTFFYRHYTKNGCSSGDFRDHGYHGGDICEPGENNNGSQKRECTGPRSLTHKQYTSADCSGTPTKEDTFSSGCTQHPVEMEDGQQKPTKWTEVWTSAAAATTAAPSTDPKATANAAPPAYSLSALGFALLARGAVTM